MSDPDEVPVPVFVSYSHKDQKWLDRLLVHLTPLENDFQIVLWADTRIRPGSQWRDEIRAALKRTKIAVLLVSADFLASDFIRKHELPPLLTSAELEGATILSLIVSPCRYVRTQEISKFQAINSPDATLVAISVAEQELAFVRLAHTIEDLVVAQRAAQIRASSAVEQNSNVLDDKGALTVTEEPPSIPVRRSLEPKSSVLAYTVEDQFEPTDNDITSVESFLEETTWAGLLKIGNWIRDAQGKRIIGAGTKTYLVSQREYGTDIFKIDTTLQFTNFTPPAGNKFGMNAGIIFGWKHERAEPRYFNILLSGSSIQIEKCGFGGDRDTRDFQKLTEPVPLIIVPGRSVRFVVDIDDSTIKIDVDGRQLISVGRPEGVVGRVGIRPWRSKVDIESFVVESF